MKATTSPDKNVIVPPFDLLSEGWTPPKPFWPGWIIALGNSAEPHDLADFIALENELALDNDGWALLAPFGEHRKERLATVNGQIVQERYVQILDETAVDAVVANEKGAGILQRLKRALIKRPIYRDHPDLKLYAPETVAMGNQALTPLGVNDGCRKSARGLEFRPLLAPDGAAAVENDGCKYPSALFLLKKTGVVRDGGWIEVRPFALASVGLTAFPNISGVDSLANAKANTPAAKPETENQENHMKQILIGWLAAQGVALANDATDQAVFDAFNKEMLTRSTSITTLGNDKTTLTTTVNTLTTDRDAQKKRADEAITALGNEQTALKTERKARLEAVTDLVITQGRLAVAERDAKVSELTALANDKLDGAITALKALPVKFAVASGISAARKDSANATTQQEAQKQILSLANSDPKYNKLPMAEAMEAIKRDQPALFEQLNTKPGSGTAATT